MSALQVWKRSRIGRRERIMAPMNVLPERHSPRSTSAFAPVASHSNEQAQACTPIAEHAFSIFAEAQTSSRTIGHPPRLTIDEELLAAVRERQRLNPKSTPPGPQSKTLPTKISWPNDLSFDREEAQDFLLSDLDRQLEEARNAGKDIAEPTLPDEEGEDTVEAPKEYTREEWKALILPLDSELNQDRPWQVTLSSDPLHEDSKQRPLRSLPDPPKPSKKFLKKQVRIADNKQKRKLARQIASAASGSLESQITPEEPYEGDTQSVMSSAAKNGTSEKTTIPNTGGHDRPLVLGRTKPAAIMDSGRENSAAAPDHEIKENVKSNTTAATPADSQPVTKKEKAPKQPKPPKVAPPSAPLSPALIDLRVGHILRAIAHPNADSLYVSTIAMGDPEGTDHTEKDEKTGLIVRTVCSGLNGLVPLADMQDRKIVVVANLKPVNMRSIKSAAMVLAASPKPEEGADPHAHDRVVELVIPPEGAEAGDRVYFEGWPYGEGRGPEKQLNPKKKQWEAIQPGFYTTEDLVVGFDASKSEVGGLEKGDLVVEGKGKCTVKTLKGAVVR